MTAAVQGLETQFAFVRTNPPRKLRAVLADESREYMEVVLNLLELHEHVDLIGRAANLAETVHLVLNYEPELLLLDLDMHLANLVVPSVHLSSRSIVRIVGLFIDETISLRHMHCLTGISQLVHRKRFRQEFLSAIDALYGKRGDSIVGTAENIHDRRR